EDRRAAQGEFVSQFQRAAHRGMGDTRLRLVLAAVTQLDRYPYSCPPTHVLIQAAGATREGLSGWSSERERGDVERPSPRPELRLPREGPEGMMCGRLRLM